MPRSRAKGLCEYADRLIEKLGELLPASLAKQDAEATHDARVAARRLRAVLDLVEPLVPDCESRPLRKSARKIRRRLGPVRDLDVMVDAALGLSRQRRHAPAAAWLLHRIDLAREAAVRKTRKKRSLRARIDALREHWKDVRARLDGREPELRELIVASLRSQWSNFAERADRLATHSLARDAESEATPDPHELRIAGKELRYTLEMLPSLRIALPAAAMRAFKRMQSELGQWHDRVVFTERAIAESVEAELAHHDPALQSQVLALATQTLREAQSHLKKFAKLWRERGHELSEIVPRLPSERARTRELTPPQTDRDPAGSGPSSDQEELPPDAQTAA